MVFLLVVLMFGDAICSSRTLKTQLAARGLHRPPHPALGSSWQAHSSVRSAMLLSEPSSETSQKPMP